MDVLLLSPLRIRDCTLRNRIVASTMLMYAATNGFPSD
jgi:2,4-dienoyl-CoA reductase-like NADH-dependent reductase (Old Yellow Enzyme family)